MHFRTVIIICGGEISGHTKNFFWGREEGKKKICWKSWDKICQAKKLVSIKNIFVFNNALMIKWKWELMMGKHGLCEVLELKYGSWRGLQLEGVNKKIIYLMEILEDDLWEPTFSVVVQHFG